jgi:hypothetical protein
VRRVAIADGSRFEVVFDAPLPAGTTAPLS